MSPSPIISKRGLVVLASALAIALAAPCGTALAQLDVCLDENAAADQRTAACGKLIDDKEQPADDRAEALAVRGSLLAAAGKHTEAIADFTRSLELSPDDPATLILRGNSYDSLGDKQKALADYSASIKAYPGDAAAYYNRGSIYQELGQKELAIADYRKALEIDPDFDSPRQGLTELGEK